MADVTTMDASAALPRHEFGTLLAISVAMFVGAFLPGYVPICASGTTPSSNSAAGAPPSGRMRVLTMFGAGLLTGTALIVIIPEGIEMWLAAQQELHEALSASTVQAHEHEHDHGHEHHHHHHENLWQIGAALASGFAFMLLVEKLGASVGGSHGHAHVSVNDGPSRTGSGLELGGIGVVKRDKKEGVAARTRPAILGLIVHATVDGVAVGASTYSGNGRVSFIIFAAIMLHKAPAAFGLSVYLTSIGLHRREIVRNLFMFSMGAPVGAISTFFVMYLELLGARARASQDAIAMLFSGGTFLFVATVHIMPEVIKFDQGLAWNEVWATVCGIMLPMLLNVGHHHGH
eukprot:m.19605 g.19605  ORF g.19605 m.19605 type:complete len:346 (+) comp3707_c0_seq2:263-1300(+)